MNKWSKNFDERPHRRGSDYSEDDVMWHRPVGSIAVRCSNGAKMHWLFAAYKATVLTM